MLAACAAALMLACAPESLTQKEIWTDTDGVRLNAHGAGILCHDGTYYMYGEYKTGPTRLNPGLGWECYRTEFTGVSCYSSRDLVHWKFRGLALAAVEDTGSDLHPGMVIERPKVIYNPATGKFVMWMHVDSDNYMKACAGVAVADNPCGPFEYLGSLRPNGGMSRDQTLFVDTDGSAWQIAASENNETLHFNRLNDEYTAPTGEYYRVMEGLSREAPVVFKRDGRYYLLSSGCSGWDPNQAQIAVADSLQGPWTILPQPCTGPDADKTFYGQSTCAIDLGGGHFIACFDVWNKLDLEDSRYFWLPVEFKPDGTVEIPWKDRFPAI